MSKSKEKGFTLLELMLVMAILSILVSVATPKILFEKKLKQKEVVIVAHNIIDEKSNMRMSEKIAKCDKEVTVFAEVINYTFVMMKNMAEFAGPICDTNQVEEKGQ